MTVILDDWRYRQVEGLGVRPTTWGEDSDRFRLYGKTFGHPTNRDGKYVYASAPVEFNEHTRIVRTVSGSFYKLGKCGVPNEEEQFRFIRRDVLRNRKVEAPPEVKTTPVPAAPVKAATPTPVRKPADNNTIISLNDIDGDEDHAFGRVFGHDNDGRHIDLVIEAEMKAREMPEAHPVAAPEDVEGREVFDADEVQHAEDE